MYIRMLGTGNALVTECYNTCFVMENNHQYLLVDGGGGNTILQQLKKANIKIEDIHHIFVTHKHIDHIMGIIWILRVIAQKINQKQYQGEAYIYAHEEVIHILELLASTLLNKKETQHIGSKIHLITVEDGQTMNIMNYPITFFDIHSTKAKQFGFSLILKNGQRLTCCGDEPYNEYEKKYVENATWLMHEAFCLDAQADIFHPYEKHHSTVKDASQLAQSYHIPHLIIYHTEDSHIHHRKERYKKEAQQYYMGKIYIPDDLETIEVEENI